MSIEVFRLPAVIKHTSLFCQSEICSRKKFRGQAVTLAFRNVLRNKETGKNPSEDDHRFQLPQLVIEITEITKETERD